MAAVIRQALGRVTDTSEKFTLRPVLVYTLPHVTHGRFRPLGNSSKLPVINRILVITAWLDIDIFWAERRLVVPVSWLLGGQ